MNETPVAAEGTIGYVPGSANTSEPSLVSVTEVIASPEASPVVVNAVVPIENAFP